MRVEPARDWRRPLRAVVIVAALVFAIGLPAGLWLTRGRKLPLSVILVADRYVAAAGASVRVRADLRPAGAEVKLAWSGPNATGSAAELRWTAPREPGVYTLTIEARRSGTIARDSVSLRVLDTAPEALPVGRPPSRARPPRELPPCKERPTAERSSKRGLLGTRPPASVLLLHGRLCPGGIVVAEWSGIPDSSEVWFWWHGDRARARSGRLANLRVPSGSGPARLRAALVDRAGGCVRLRNRELARETCAGGPLRAGLFAGFGWYLISESVFQFTAKPPRIRGSSKKARPRYIWTFDGKRRQSRLPVLTHRFARSRYHLARLEVLFEGESVSTTRAIIDRTVK